MKIMGNCKYGLRMTLVGFLFPAVVLCNPPEIFLEAAPQLVRPGGRVWLRWQVRNADSVTLDGISVKHFGERLIRPAKSQTFRLAAKRGFEEFIKAASVTVANPRITGLELCGAVGELNSHFRCFSHGPFTRNNRIHAIVRFADLSAGWHRLHKQIFEFRQGSWRVIHREASRLENPRAGLLEISFQLPKLGTGRRKFQITLDRRERSSVLYCIECPVK